MCKKLKTKTDIPEIEYLSKNVHDLLEKENEYTTDSYFKKFRIEEFISAYFAVFSKKFNFIFSYSKWYDLL
jgi:hypothetical protein